MIKKCRSYFQKLPVEWRVVIKRLLWLLLLIPALYLPALASENRAFVERAYSQGIFPLIRDAGNFIFGFAPFSIAEWALYALILLVPAGLIALLILLLKKRISFARCAHYIASALAVACVILNVFYFFWGFHYSREPLPVLLDLPIRERSIDALEEACYILAHSANEIRPTLPEDENGVVALSGSIRESFLKIPPAYEKLSKSIPFLKGSIAPPKMVMGSKGMSILGISGIYVPFTFEANVNVHQPALLLPVTAAHESAHALGIAREDEANFIAYLACLASEDEALMYSGLLLALINCGNQLYAHSHEKYEDLWKTYDAGIVRDLQHHSAYWKGFEGPVQEKMDAMNDQYLRFHHQESGIQSYGEMVDLLLAWFDKQGLLQTY